jgi:hypothetical protein
LVLRAWAKLCLALPGALTREDVTLDEIVAHVG